MPVIVTDPQADGRLWSEVLNQGGYDLLTQPFYAPEVRRILGNAVTPGLLDGRHRIMVSSV